MSERRMTRREMRMAGLLKPKSAEEPGETPVHEEHTGTGPEPAGTPVTEPQAGELAEGQEPAEQAQGAVEPAEDSDKHGLDTPGTQADAGASVDASSEKVTPAEETAPADEPALADEELDATAAHDTVGEFGKSSDASANEFVDDSATDDDQAAEVPERQSVFDRFSSTKQDPTDVAGGGAVNGDSTVNTAEQLATGGGALKPAAQKQDPIDQFYGDQVASDEKPEDAVDKTADSDGKPADKDHRDSDSDSADADSDDPATSEKTDASAKSDSGSSRFVAEPVIPAAGDEDEADEDETEHDFAGALRAELKSRPPVETESSARSADAAEEEEAPASRWKTIVLFLLLIVVGFGVGILLGSLIFSGGGASASALAVPASLTFYPGVL